MEREKTLVSVNEQHNDARCQDDHSVGGLRAADLNNILVTAIINRIAADVYAKTQAGTDIWECAGLSDEELLARAERVERLSKKAIKRISFLGG